MIIKFKISIVPAIRAGIYDVKKKTYICPENIESLTPKSGNFFYLVNGQSLQLQAGDYELHLSAGMRYLPIKTKLTRQSRQVISIIPKPFEPYDSSYLDSDLHIHGPFRDSQPIPPITHENLPIEFLAERMTFPCCVDVDAPSLKISPSQQLQQTAEYRSGTFGHYLFLGAENLPTHDREHYSNHSAPKLPKTLFAKVKKAGGFILCAHPVTSENIFDGSSWPGGGYARGLPALLNLGLVDAISLGDTSALAGMTKQLWYQLLNTGRRIYIASGTDICMRQPGNPFPAIGTCRTVVPKDAIAGSEYSFANFLSAIKSGNAYVSSGPMLNFTVDGVGMGKETASNDVHKFKINIHSPKPVDTVNIIINGQTFKTFSEIGQYWAYDDNIELDEGSWIAVECTGQPDWWYPLGLWAHTNPIFIAGRPNRRIRAGAERFFMKMSRQLNTCLKNRGMSQPAIKKICDLTLCKER